MAYTTPEDICNAALARLGVDPIVALTDQNPRARICNVLYDNRRKALLRKGFWNFATGRAVLTADPTPPAFGYKYRFPLPSDCVQVRIINADYDTQFETEQGFIVTDDSACELKYTADITDVTKFDITFAEALALDIAHEACMALTGSNSRKQDLKDDARIQLQLARSMDAFEQSPGRVEANAWNNARY